MKLQELFTEAQYNECIEKIKRKEYFKVEIKGKNFNFTFSHEFCDNGHWKDNRNVGVYLLYGCSGFCYGMSIDNIESYYEICYKVNRVIVADRLEGVKHKGPIRLSIIVIIKKLLKNKADIVLIRDLFLDTTIDEKEQDRIISIIKTERADAFCKAICARLRALGYEVLL